MTSKRVDFIRHPRSEDNDNGLIIGGQNISVPLSRPVGEAQAIELGRNYPLGPDGRLVSSGAKRSDDGLSLAFPGRSFETDARFLELDQGDHEGRLRSEVYTPEFIQQAERDNWDHRAPNGESWQELYERVYDGLQDHAESGSPLVVMSHTTAIKALTGKQRGLSQSEALLRPDQQVGNTKLSRLVDNGRGWQVEFVGKDAKDVAKEDAKQKRR